MTLDYFVFLETRESLENTPVAWRLTGGFVDHVSKCFLEAEIKRLEAERSNNREGNRQAEQEKTRRRKEYMEKAPRRFPVKLYPGLQVDFSTLLSEHWLAFQVDFELLTPWYSKDDRLFHVLDNPVRKDWVFGVPFMAASSWKGMLRWACRMQEGLRDYLEKHDRKMEDWQDSPWILQLFGNEKSEEEAFHQGALVFYPTWFDKIGFEVINPHSRKRRAGTQPIYYEVVPPGAKGTLSLLYAPWPGMKPSVKPEEVLPKLLEAIETLLTTYGISAKRTVGWGTASIAEWKIYQKRYAETLRVTRQEFDKFKAEETSTQDKRFWEFVWEKIKARSFSGGTP
jgi:CRISPR-associated protein Cmr2